MNFSIIAVCFFVLIIGTVTTNYVSAQIDPLSEIIFFQTGELHTNNNHYTQIIINFKLVMNS
jgi:hypothetical protein